MKYIQLFKIQIFVIVSVNYQNNDTCCLATMEQEWEQEKIGREGISRNDRSIHSINKPPNKDGIYVQSLVVKPTKMEQKIQPKGLKEVRSEGRENEEQKIINQWGKQEERENTRVKQWSVMVISDMTDEKNLKF